MARILSETGTKEYDPIRHHEAVAKTARANKMPVGDAENFAKNVVAKVEMWLHDKEEITAEELRAVTAGVMAEYDEDSAYMYGSENRMF